MINFSLLGIIHAWQKLALQEVLQQKKLYQELGLESFKSRHWFRKLIRYTMKNPPRIY